MEENETYRKFFGLNKGKVPSHDTVSRFNRNLTNKRLKTIFRKLDDLLTGDRVFDQDELTNDVTDILSNPCNKHNSDLDAGYSHKSDGECFYGFWLVYVTSTTSEIVRAVEVTPTYVHQSNTAHKSFRQLKSQDLQNATLFVADSAYDDKKTYDKSIDLKLAPLIAYNPRRSKIKLFDRLKATNWLLINLMFISMHREKILTVGKIHKDSQKVWIFMEK